MLKPTIEKSLNTQLNREYYASYLYLALSSFFEETGYSGFAQWMRHHSQEEYAHMMKIYRYIFDRDGSVILGDVKAPSLKGKDVLEVINEAFAHEKKVSGYINDLVDLCIKEKDHATNQFLQWFVAEQVEEEALFQDVARRIKIIGDNKAALYLIDKELGSNQKGGHQ